MSESMRETFREHHRLREDEIKDIWRKCIFALDTNVLLNIYRYPSATRADLFRVLEHLRDRIWVPYQVASEFYRKRIGVIRDQSSKYDELLQAISASLNQFDDGAFRKSGFLQVEELKDILRPAVDQAMKVIHERHAAHPDLIRDDPYLESVTRIIEARLGKEPNAEEREKLCQEAQRRIELKQPPGYQDHQKPAPDRYGDVLIWFELLGLGGETKRPVVFVTDDDKEDWWQIIAGQKLGPRPELREEMRKKSGVEFWIYNPARLLEMVGQELTVSVSPTSIDDAKKVAEDLRSRPQEGRLVYRGPAGMRRLRLGQKAEEAVAEWLARRHPTARIEPSAVSDHGVDIFLSEEEMRIGVAGKVFNNPSLAPFMNRQIREAGYRAHYQLSSGYLTKYLLVFVSPDEQVANRLCEAIFSRRAPMPSPAISIGYLDEKNRYQELRSRA